MFLLHLDLMFKFLYTTVIIIYIFKTRRFLLLEGHCPFVPFKVCKIHIQNLICIQNLI